MKTMISSLSFFETEDTQKHSSEAIIPFQDEKIITFSFFFSKDNINVRGGKQKYSLTVIFGEKDRLKVYNEANRLSDFLKKIGRLMELHLTESNEIPQEFIEISERMFADCFNIDFDRINRENVIFSVTCPICAHRNEVNLRLNIEGLNIVEYTIYENDLCSHQFSVIVNSKFDILCYKESKIDIQELKDLIWKIKTPYDSLLEGQIVE